MSNNLIKITKEIVLKKIKKILRNAFSRPRVNIYWIIVTIGVLTVALLLTGCDAGWSNLFSDVGPEWSPDGSKIAFVKPTYYKEGNNWGVIWVMNADGSNKIKLTDDTEKLDSPAWSPDGSKIAFRSGPISYGPGPWDKGDIWVMNADGSNKINLTNKPGCYGEPVWSPDGSKIVFKLETSRPSLDIWVMNSDGSNKIKLGGGDSPAGSPDGSKIAFLSGNNIGSSDISVMNADGSNKIKLTNKYSAYSPAWSPDGSKIAFGFVYANNKGDIWVMNADGSNMINLTNKSGGGPVWSPDGSKIAFGSESDIWVMNADGSNKINLTNSAANYYSQTWSPDGSKISFVSAGAEEKFDIWVMNTDGSNKINLTGIK